MTPDRPQSARQHRKEAQRVEITTGDAVDRSGLTVDWLKWYLCKLAPKKYGLRRVATGKLPEATPAQPKDRQGSGQSARLNLSQVGPQGLAPVTSI